MSKSLEKILLICFVGMCFFSCEQKKDSIIGPPLKKNYKWMSDSFNKTVWKDYSYDEYFLKKTWMTNIEKGFDSIYIRLWYHDSDTAALQVIEFKKPSSEDWSCAYNVIVPDSSNTEIRSYKRIFLARQPKSGWEIFIRKLFELNISNLRSEENIPRYESITDGNSVHVEIANDTGYRIYKLKYLKANPEIIDAVNMSEIIKLISEELDIRPYSEI